MIEPFYQDDLVTLFHGTCVLTREFRDLPLVPEWLDADVLVTDPPYGIAYASNMVKGRAKEKIAGDADPGVRDAALAAWGDRPALVFGRWDVPRPVRTRQRIVWDKNSPGMGDLGMPWGPGEEEVYVLGEGFTGSRGSNVVKAQMLVASDPRRPDHPTPKPVALMEALIAKCPPGVIADPFAGSGATLIAARNLGRKVIGVEASLKHCKTTVARLQQQAFDLEGLA